MSEQKILRLGERELQLLFAFEERKQGLFTIGEAKEILGGSDASVKNVLQRLKAKKRVIRIERGKYLFAPMESGREGHWSEHSLVLVPALVGKSDYYVGLLTALNYWSMTEQIPIVIFVITKKKKRGLEAFGAKYVFVNMKLGGYEKVKILGKTVNVSSREQTILDCLSHPEYSLGVSEVAKGIHAADKELDWPKLAELCLREKEVVRRRLGYLLELLGKRNAAKKLEKKFKGFAWLDPHLSKKRLGYSKRWGLILNSSEQDLFEFQRGY
ncbi:MAG: type IV toxin-antitoxin system AbiEi family antitoxin [Candidatus Micrarchaeota archaeon]